MNLTEGHVILTPEIFKCNTDFDLDCWHDFARHDDHTP